jgi:hypothetical protein
MFTWMNKQGVRSDEGFEVQSTGRFTIEYREQGKVITISVEPGLSGGPCVLLEDKPFRFWDDCNIQNSSEEQKRLLNNFIAAMKFQGLGVL